MGRSLGTIFPESLKRLEQDLAKVHSTEDVIRVVLSEVQKTLDIHNVWLYLHDQHDDDTMRLITLSGGMEKHSVYVIPVKGDAFIEEVVFGRKPVYAKEASLDPRTNKEIVTQLGNRTIYNAPVSIYGVDLGVFGMGTFKEEGVRDLGLLELDYLQTMAFRVAETLWRVGGESFR